MSYKSYAQAGQFGTYHIDLPIKAEINEDLRAAGNFAKQMELSQQYREKWANSYLSALNEKSNIERQNRDDNFEFLQNNFKRIYEGEQREFEGRLAELRREQYEAANAEPSTIEKLMPVLMKLAPMALSVIGQMKTAEIQATNEWSQGITDTLQQNGNLITVPELANLKKMATQNPSIAEALFKGRAEGTGVGWQDFQRYTMLSGEAEAFRNMNTGLIHLGKVEHLLRQKQLPGGPLDAATFAGNNLEYYKAYNKEIADAKRQVFGDYKLNDTTRAALNKWEAGLRNDFERKAFNTWEGQAKAQIEQQEQHKFNFIVTQPDAEVGPAMYARYESRRDYYMNERGFPRQDAHVAAFKDIDNSFLDPNSLADSGDYQRWLDTFFKRRDEYIIAGGGAPIEKGKGWAYETSAVTMRKMVEKSFELTTYATNVRLNEEDQIWNNFNTKFNKIPRGSAEAQSFITQFQQEVKDSGKIFSQKFMTKVLGLGFTDNKPKTFEDLTGITRASLNKTAGTLILKSLQSSGSAWNATQSKKDLLDLQETQETISEVVGNAMVNWTKYAGEFPHITNPEALRKEILTRSYQDLMDKGEIGLENVNADGTAKVPADPVTFKSIGGKNPTGITVQDFEHKAKQEGDKFFKTFTPLTPTDRIVYDNYAQIRGSMSVGENPDHHDMQMMADTPRMRSLMKIFGDKYTKWQLMDLDLKSLGYEGLRTIPLNKTQVATQRGIAKRILEGSARTTTTQNLRFVNSVTNGVQNKGKLVDTGLKTYDGKPLRLSDAGAAQAMQAAFKAADEAGVDLSVVINNAYRSHSENAATQGSSSNSNHLWGGAVDINWDAPGAYWWKENAHHFGFVYNPYNSKSTHYDFDAAAWNQSPYSKQKLEPISVQPQQQQPSNQVNTTDKYIPKVHKPGEPLTEEGVLNPNYQPEQGEPNQWWDFLDLFPNERRQQVPDQLEGLEPSFMQNGTLVGVINGQKVKVLPNTTTPIPISDQLYETMLENRDKDKPFIPRATLSGGN